MPADGEDDGLQMLHLVAEEGDALFVLAQARERKTELGAHEKTAQQIDDHQDAEREVVIDRSFRDLVTSERHRRDRRDAVLPAEIIPAPRQTVGRIRSGQGPERDEDHARGMPSEQQKAAEQQRKDKADQHSGRKHDQYRGDVEVARDQRDAVAGRAEEQGLAEAHDAGVAPHQVERQREQREDRHAGGEDRQVVLQHEWQDQRDGQRQNFHDRKHLPPRRLLPCRNKSGESAVSHQFVWSSAGLYAKRSPRCARSPLSIPSDRRDPCCARRSRSFRSSRPPCTSSSCNGACRGPFRRARPDLPRSWRGRARQRRPRVRPSWLP